MRNHYERTNKLRPFETYSSWLRKTEWEHKKFFLTRNSFQKNKTTLIRNKALILNPISFKWFRQGKQSPLSVCTATAILVAMTCPKQWTEPAEQPSSSAHHGWHQLDKSHVSSALKNLKKKIRQKQTNGYDNSRNYLALTEPVSLPTQKVEIKSVRG